MSQTFSSTESSDEIERLRAQLRQAEARLAEVQRIAGIGYWERDVAADRAWWSDEFRSILGVGSNLAAPALEVAIEAFVHPDDRQMVHQAFQNTIANGAPFDNESRIVRRDGTVRVVHARGERVVGAAGAVTRVMGTVADITERKRLEQILFESEARCRSIFERVPLGIVVLGYDGQFLMFNPAWIQMIGYSAEDLAHLSLLEVMHPDDRTGALSVRASADAGNPGDFSLDLRYLRRNGEVFPARTIGAALRDSQGAVTGAVAIIEDVTEEKEIERRRGDRQREQRDALVREVHHRIKNHLQGVAGLLERHATANAALEPAIEELLGRLNALATVHGLQSEQPGRELNLCNIARGIVDTLQVVSAVPLEFVLPQGFVPVEVNVDEAVPVALILNELVSNAVKHFAPSAKQAAVKIEMKRDGVRALVAVRNAPASLPPSFDFADGRTLGTGLHLAKSLLPVEGARLSFSQPAPGVVESLLALWPPVLNHARNSARET